MSLKSVNDVKFLGPIEDWLRREKEILVQVQYSRAAGSKSFEFITSPAGLAERLRQLPPSSCITAFAQPLLSVRGCVDDDFIGECLHQIPDGCEFLVVGTTASTAGDKVWFAHEAGMSHQELIEALNNFRGEQVAAGEYPQPSKDGKDSVVAYVADKSGNVRSGVY